MINPNFTLKTISMNFENLPFWINIARIFYKDSGQFIISTVF